MELGRASRISVTFSSTHRKCTDRQNLLFSTLAPGMEFVFFNKALYTWEGKNNFHNLTFSYIYCFFTWSKRKQTSSIMGRNSVAAWKKTGWFPWMNQPEKYQKKFENTAKRTRNKSFVFLHWNSLCCIFGVWMVPWCPFHGYQHRKVLIISQSYKPANLITKKVLQMEVTGGGNFCNILVV